MSSLLDASKHIEGSHLQDVLNTFKGKCKLIPREILIEYTIIFCRETKPSQDSLGLNKAEVQLADVNEYAVTIPQSQHVVVKGSVREQLPPGLAVKSSHIRIGESIGQGTSVFSPSYIRHVSPTAL